MGFIANNGIFRMLTLTPFFKKLQNYLNERAITFLLNAIKTKPFNKIKLVKTGFFGGEGI